MRYLKINMIVALSLLFVACHKVDVEQHNDPAMMSFEPQLEAVGESLTRGTPITAVSDMKDMGVFVYNTGTSEWATAASAATPNIMNNQKIEQKTAGTWSYAPLIPWQKQYNTMFAYAPFATAENGITVQSSYTGAPSIEYEVPATCVNQPDLMVAVRQEDKSSGTTSFAMEHALACVGFMVKGEGTRKKISKISVKGVSVSGTLSLDHAKDGVPSWSSLATATDTEYTSGIKTDLTLSNTLADAMNTDGYLMMIPQVLGSDAKLIVAVDGVEREVSLSGKEWQAGVRYTYSLDVASSGTTIIGNFGGWDDVNKEYTKLLEVEAVASSSDPLLVWSPSHTPTLAYNKQYGLPNVELIKTFSSDLSNFPAAKYCYDKGDGWYLPSQNQLMAIWVMLEGLPSEFALSDSAAATVGNYGYWSSTELYGAAAWYVSFFNGYTVYSIASIGKTNAMRVRCVRDVQ